jgi:hypothetical protein
MEIIELISDFFIVRVLCETVRDMIGKIDASPSNDSEIDEKCAALTQKLDSLLQTLNEESENFTNASANANEDQDESDLQVRAANNAESAKM